jgi:hypothetical protein
MAPQPRVTQLHSMFNSKAILRNSHDQMLVSIMQAKSLVVFSRVLSTWRSTACSTSLSSRYLPHSQTSLHTVLENARRGSTVFQCLAAQILGQQPAVGAASGGAEGASVRGCEKV